MNSKTFLLIIIFLSLPTIAIGADGPVGSIVHIEGVCDIARAGSEVDFTNEGDLVYQGDRIRTKTYSKAEIAFNDKSIVKLGPSSCIIVEEFKIGRRKKRDHARIKLTRGKVEAIVAKTGKPDTFVIITPNAESRVKGSDIFVLYQAGKTGVLVKEGSVAVANPALPKKTVNVIKGDSVLVPFTEAPGVTRPYFAAEMKLHRRDVERSLLKKWLPRKGAAAMSGHVTMVTGIARIYKARTSAWKDAQLNDIVAEGNKIQTGEDGRIEIRLDNGNTIYLQANSELAFEKMRIDAASKEYANVFTSNRGKIKAVIERYGKQSTFQVKTPAAVCGPRGTIMYLDIAPDATQAFFEGGAGIITSEITGKSMNIAAGHHSSADISGLITTPIYTTNEQRMTLDQQWGGANATDIYSAPTSATAREAVFQPSLMREPATGGMAAGDVGSDTILAEQPFNQLPFDETTHNAVNGETGGTSPPILIYNTTIGFDSGSPNFNGGSITVDLKSDGTWTATLSGTTGGTVNDLWNLTFSDSSGDDVMLTNGSPAYGGGDVPWTATVAPANSIFTSPDPDKQLQGNASGWFRSSPAPGAYDGTASGTWSSL